jgi:hypothetical protein
MTLSSLPRVNLPRPSLLLFLIAEEPYLAREFLIGSALATIEAFVATCVGNCEAVVFIQNSNIGDGAAQRTEDPLVLADEVAQCGTGGLG